MSHACTERTVRPCHTIFDINNMKQLENRVHAASQHVICPRLIHHLSRRCANRTAQITYKNAFQPCRVAYSASVANVDNTWGGSVESCTASAKHVQLIRWICQHGGYVHPSLSIVDSAPCGCRGVIASTDICMPLGHHQPSNHAWGLDDAPNADNSTITQLLQARSKVLLPVIAVPEELYMTTEDALDILTEVILQHDPQVTSANSRSNDSSSNATDQSATLGRLLANLLPAMFRSTMKHQQEQLAASLAKLQPPLLLALLLAYERTQGKRSRWYPYISTLPDEPPCAWYSALPMTSHPDQQHWQQAGHDEAALLSAVAAAAAAVHNKCSRTAQMFGPALNISTDDLLWAFGQVVSRAFGHGNDVGLAPLIDMLNHKQGAATPQLLTTEPQQSATTLPLAEAACTTPPAALTDSTADAAQRRGSNSSAPSGMDDSTATGRGRPVSRVMTATHTDHHITSTVSSDASCALQGSYGNQRRFWAVCLAPQQQHTQAQQQPQKVLSAGEELYISYIASCDAATAYLNFGFVPVEKMPRRDECCVEEAS